MKMSLFTEDQMIRILREADQTSVAAAAKALVFSWCNRGCDPGCSYNDPITTV